MNFNDKHFCQDMFLSYKLTSLFGELYGFNSFSVLANGFVRRNLETLCGVCVGVLILTPICANVPK